jgi:hypothetical protein
MRGCLDVLVCNRFPAVFPPIPFPCRFHAGFQFQYKRIWSDDEAISWVSFSSPDEKSAVNEKSNAIAHRDLHLNWVNLILSNCNSSNLPGLLDATLGDALLRRREW